MRKEKRTEGKEIESEERKKDRGKGMREFGTKEGSRAGRAEVGRK